MLDDPGDGRLILGIGAGWHDPDREGALAPVNR